MTTVSRTHRSRRAVVGATAGLVLALGAPLAASAHVHVSPEAASAGATETLTFSFSHGCDGSPTTSLAVDIPEGVGNATPVAQGGWTITRDLGADGVPTRVVYTADAPIDDALKAAVSMDVLFTEDTADTSIAFPVTQTCVTGETAWTQIAEDGQDPHDLDAPAPVVTVGAVADDAGHDHAAGDGHSGSADAEATAETEAVASGTGADPVARWLAAGGLAAGIAALAIVLVRGRRRA
ncbi:YcnI family protein [Microbacterium sp. M3]|uniref:YcnI family protein n=1 Tax=Microbacterium arthrosphaerae TaxID=792652 RepID=A0ABU4H1I8_9MICO|nr:MULTISPECIES: YcnI family protein [Microbacterium]MDW4573192.1 YcnI family protein [Microbacterium arthrosphaerae]MDW7607047.1 YcnI family protein [Microbacterium sp. M3]